VEDNRLPKQLLNYHPKGRWPRRPLKRLLDDMTAETKTGYPGLDLWWNMMMMMMMIWLPFDSWFYTMGSPLSSVVANQYMEYFEVHVLDTAILKPSCWFRCADDTFVIWSHDLQEIQNFFYCLNSIPSNIQFTMEEERKVT
jgi:hypothetical protein